MKKTRYSLYYLATYLTLTGIFFLVIPETSLKLLMATGTYDLPFVQLTGAFMIALGALIIQMIRYRIQVLYTTTLFVRVFFIITIIWLYYQTSDRMFLLILGVVALGFVLTLSGFLLDRSKSLKQTGSKTAATSPV
jgi:uncharacterized protein YjeT (DUF2065 family)